MNQGWASMPAIYVVLGIACGELWTYSPAGAVPSYRHRRFARENGAHVMKRFMPGVAIVLSLVATSFLSAEQPSIDGLARDVERAEAIRAVKNLQRNYAQYAQVG